MPRVVLVEDHPHAVDGQQRGDDGDRAVEAQADEFAHAYSFLVHLEQAKVSLSENRASSLLASTTLRGVKHHGLVAQKHS